MFGRSGGIGVIEILAIPVLLCMGPKAVLFAVTGAMFFRGF